MAIVAFAGEYHDMKVKSRDSKQQGLSLVGISPWPPISPQEEK
jgi:hypothetical protein